MRMAMEDLQLDLRRSLRLIGTLDKRTNELMEDVDDQLKKLQGMSVGDSFRGDVVTDVARKSSDARLLRLNCLDEAKYMCESVEYVYSQISAEIVKLKNPAWVKDGESNAGKVEMRLTRRQRQEKEEAEKRRENEVEAEKMRAKEKEKEKKDEQAAQKKREARAADKKRHEVETTEKANSRKKKQGREENKRNVQRQKRKRGAQGEPVEQEEAEETEAADDEPRYCFCNDVFYGEMIGCDDPKCKKEWFHLGCVNLRRAPKGEWICPECTERRQKDAQRKRKRRR